MSKPAVKKVVGSSTGGVAAAAAAVGGGTVKRQSINSMSSIRLDNSDGKINPKHSQQDMRGHEDFADFDDFDLSSLATDIIYKSPLPGPASIHGRDAYLSAEETLKRLMSSTWAALGDRELNLKIPAHSIFKTFETTEKAMSLEGVCPDDSKIDYLTKGLNEDVEPSTSFQDAWLRSKIHVDTYFKEENTITRNVPQSRQNDVQSKRRSSKTSSIAGTMNNNTKKNNNNNLDYSGFHLGGATKNGNLLPAPIDLTEPLNLSITEENMRNKKENERKDKEDKIAADTQKRQTMFIEEQQKFTKFQKENKATGFTYDYTGEMIPVQKVKINKLPATAMTVHFGFKDDDNGQSKDSKKKKQKKGATEPVSKFKKAPEQEKEFARLITNPPPTFDNILLNTGVALTFDGRKRVGPPQTATEVQQLTNPTATGSKIRLGRKEYDEIIKSGGFNRQKLDNPDFNATAGPAIGGSTGGAGAAATLTSTTNRLLATAPDGKTQTANLDKEADLNNQAKVKFLKKVQQNTIGGRGDVNIGKIKVQSAKVFEQLGSSAASEEESRAVHELAELRRKEMLASHYSGSEKGNLGKSPIDEFNLQITKQQEWGKSHYGLNNLGNLQYAKHKTTQKDLLESLGKNRVKPRERILINSASMVNSQVNDLRASTSEGFFRNRILKTSEGNRVGTSHAQKKNPDTAAAPEAQAKQQQLQSQSAGQKKNS